MIFELFLFSFFLFESFALYPFSAFLLKPQIQLHFDCFCLLVWTLYTKPESELHFLLIHPLKLNNSEYFLNRLILSVSQKYFVPQPLCIQLLQPPDYFHLFWHAGHLLLPALHSQFSHLPDFEIHIRQSQLFVP